MEQLIQDQDVVYEVAILANPHDLGEWTRYLESKRDRPLVERCFVLERATQQLPRSYKLWKQYLDVRKQHSLATPLSVRGREIDRVLHLYERALLMLHKMPRLWTDYLELLILRRVAVTRLRERFDGALQALPSTQHDRIWPLYISAVSDPLMVNDITCLKVWARYVMFDRAKTLQYVDMLVDRGRFEAACLELIRLLDSPDRALVLSQNRVSSYSVWEKLAELLRDHSHTFHELRDRANAIILAGETKYPDQQGKLVVFRAQMWLSRGMMEKARDVFEHGISSARTVRDFSLVFDSFAKMYESWLANHTQDVPPQSTLDVDRMLDALEQLLDRRSFLINELLLKQDPNNVNEWLKRVALWGNNKSQIAATYAEALAKISPTRASGKLFRVWIEYARFYETEGQPDTARTVFDKATKVPFRSVNHLAEVWIAWAEFELGQGDFQQAVCVMETGTRGPKHSKIDYFDDAVSAQDRLHKSMKLWAFYADLLESNTPLDFGALQKVYERMFELKIATPLTVVNYANVLEEHQRFEDAFKVYERGVALFEYPTAFELWNVYLHKATARQLGIERLRDLFEHALQDCPADLSKPLFLMYGKLEEDRGLLRNAMSIYSRGAQAVDIKDRRAVYEFYIARAASNFGLPATRTIFEQALQELPNSDTRDLCLQFILVEEKLGEIDRARALYGFCSQFCDPSLSAEDFWSKWDAFELKYGNEDTYKEMLRVKRSVKATMDSSVRNLAAKYSHMITAGPSTAMDFVSENRDRPHSVPPDASIDSQ